MCLHMQNLLTSRNTRHTLMMVCASLACPPRPVCLFTPLKMHYCVCADIFLDLIDESSWRHCSAYWMLKQLLLLTLAWEILSNPGRSLGEGSGYYSLVLSIVSNSKAPRGLLALALPQQQHGHCVYMIYACVYVCCAYIYIYCVYVYSVCVYCIHLMHVLYLSLSISM